MNRSYEQRYNEHVGCVVQELHELETMVIDDSSIRSLVKEDKQRLLAEVGQIEVCIIK